MALTVAATVTPCKQTLFYQLSLYDMHSKCANNTELFYNTEICNAHNVVCQLAQEEARAVTGGTWWWCMAGLKYLSCINLDHIN